jgi:hypothetical protein
MKVSSKLAMLTATLALGVALARSCGKERLLIGRDPL